MIHNARRFIYVFALLLTRCHNSDFHWPFSARHRTWWNFLEFICVQWRWTELWPAFKNQVSESPTFAARTFSVVIRKDDTTWGVKAQFISLFNLNSFRSMNSMWSSRFRYEPFFLAYKEVLLSCFIHRSPDLQKYFSSSTSINLPSGYYSCLS